MAGAALPVRYVEPAPMGLKPRIYYGIIRLKVHRSGSVKSRRAGMGKEKLTLPFRWRPFLASESMQGETNAQARILPGTMSAAPMKTA